jgi:hypothetical protein
MTFIKRIRINKDASFVWKLLCSWKRLIRSSNRANPDEDRQETQSGQVVEGSQVAEGGQVAQRGQEAEGGEEYPDSQNPGTALRTTLRTATTIAPRTTPRTASRTKPKL